MLPVGGMFAWSGPLPKLPSDYLLCDGRLLRRPAYPQLFDAIGTTWGGDGADGFYLPDLRGQFLRGVDHDHGRAPSDPPNDPDRDQRTPAAPHAANPGAQQNNVGSRQVDAFQAHTHDYQDQSEPGNPNTFDDGNRRGLADHQRTTAGPSGRSTSETRPVNVYVYWVIRAKP